MATISRKKGTSPRRKSQPSTDRQWLTLAEERHLVQRMLDGDLAARDKLWLVNQPFVISLAKRFLSSGIELSELVSAGNEGYSEGLKRYRLGKKARLLTYVGWWVWHHILDAVNQGKNVQPAEYVDFSQTPEASPDDAVIRDELRTSLDEALCLLTERQRTILFARTGWQGTQVLTSREIAQNLGISRSMVNVELREVRTLVRTSWRFRKLRSFIKA